MSSDNAWHVIILLMINGHINKSASYFFKQEWNNNSLKMLVGTWECCDPWNIGRKKWTTSLKERENHEAAVEGLVSSIKRLSS